MDRAAFAKTTILKLAIVIAAAKAHLPAMVSSTYFNVRTRNE